MFKYLKKYPVSYVFCIEYDKVDDDSKLLKDLQSIPYVTSMVADTDHYKLLGYDKRVYWIRILEDVIKILKEHRLGFIGYGEDPLCKNFVWKEEMFIVPLGMECVEIWNKGNIKKFSFMKTEETANEQLWGWVKALYHHKRLALVDTNAKETKTPTMK